MVVTSGYSAFGHLSNTETIDIGNNLEPPYYPDHPRRINAATGGFLHQDFVTCGGVYLAEGTVWSNHCRIRTGVPKLFQQCPCYYTDKF